MHSRLCTPADHALSRRRVLGAFAGGAAGLGLGPLVRPAVAEDLKANDKQVLLVWLDGGMSQLESWDPKPNTRFGGPYRAIDTSVPGLRVSELMPKVATRMQHLSVVRSMKTEDPNHSSGVPKILRGHPKNRGVTYPYFGSAVARLMGPGPSGLPPYVWVKPGSGGFVSKHAGFLGAKYGALALGDGKPPNNLLRPDTIDSDADRERNELRELFERRYRRTHRPGWSEANTHVYDVARTLMKNVELFDESKLDPQDVERYGRHHLGRHLLLARRVLEAGVRFVQVTSYGWDTHGDNFNAHARRVPGLDQPLAAVLDDLHDRGMLENVLVVVMAEFGRTPRVNGSVGRDHWPNAWSLATGGCGIVPGQVVGATNDDGTDVAGTPYDIGSLFHTWFHALGIDSRTAEYHNGTQPLPVAHDDMQPIRELLA